MNDSNPRGGRPAPNTDRPRVRWRFATVLLVLGAAAELAIWLGADLNRQDRNLRMTAVAAATCLLLLVWLCLFSRLPRKLRLGVALGFLSLGALAAATLEIGGVTGDLVPIVRWRWTKAPEWNVEPAPPVPAPPAPADDAAVEGNPFPQFLGPNRNGVLSGPSLSRDWSESAPRELWRREVGAGWSGFAILGDRAVTQEQRGENETVVCYRLTDGRPLWVHADVARYMTTLGGEGPRATPTLAGGRVYALGATGILNCLSLDDGRLIWSKNILADNGARLNEWGMSGSPLVWNDWVLVSPGGSDGRSLVAYDSRTGERVWSGGHDAAGYSSPQFAILDGAPQFLIFNAASVAGHAADSGELLWEHPWRAGHPHVAMPVVLSDDRVLVSSGYGTGSELLQVKRSSEGNWEVQPIWKSIFLKAKFTNVVPYEGFIYGLDDGIMTCLDIETGRRQWKDGRYGHGQVLLVRDLLIVTAENGDVVLLEPQPGELRELGRITAFEDKTWNPPALAGNRLLARNHKEAALFELPLRDETSTDAPYREGSEL